MSNAASRRRSKWAEFLPDIFRDAGLPVIVDRGWERRGKPFTEILAVVPHHTASNPRGGVAPSMPILRSGRSDVPGPLCNWSTGRDAVIRVVAAGAANHPGVSELVLPTKTITSGVKYYALGDEIELSGVGEPFPTTGRQYEVAHRAYAAVCLYLDLDPMVAVQDHKLIARPRGRKIDVHPYDLDAGRRRVRALVSTVNPTTTTPTSTSEEDELMAAKDEIIAEVRQTMPYAVRVNDADHQAQLPYKSVWICDGMTRRRPTRADLNWCYFTKQVQQPSGGPCKEPLVPSKLIVDLVDVTPK